MVGFEPTRRGDHALRVVGAADRAVFDLQDRPELRGGYGPARVEAGGVRGGDRVGRGVHAPNVPRAYDLAAPRKATPEAPPAQLGGRPPLASDSDAVRLGFPRLSR